MRYFLSLFMCLCGLGAAAQDGSWHLSFHNGFTMHTARFKNNNIRPVVEDIGIWMDLRLWREVSNWQLGVHTGTGIMRQSISHDMEVYRNNSLAGTQNLTRRYYILSQALVGEVFGHYKIMMPKGHHLFAGPALGVLTGRNTLDGGRRITAFTGGFTWGISLKLHERLRFEVAHGWRTASFRLADNAYDIQPDNGSGDYMLVRLSRMNINYVSNTFGLNMRL